MTVTVGGSVGECGRLNQPASFRAHYNIVILTYLLTYHFELKMHQNAFSGRAPHDLLGEIKHSLDFQPS